MVLLWLLVRLSLEPLLVCGFWVCLLVVNAFGESACGFNCVDLDVSLGVSHACLVVL